MRIPNRLATYDERHWLPDVEDSISFPELRAREKWRQGQDAWAHQHGLDRAQFEALLRRQKAGRQTIKQHDETDIGGTP